MKKSRDTDEQIALALKQAELGTSVAEVCRKMGVSRATFFHRRQKLGGLGPSELRKLRQFAEEKAKRKWLVAALSLDKAMLRNAPAKSPDAGRRRELVDHIKDRFGVSERQGCRALRFHRSSQATAPAATTRRP